MVLSHGVYRDLKIQARRAVLAFLSLALAAAGCAEPTPATAFRAWCVKLARDASRIRTLTLGSPRRVSVDIPRRWRVDPYSIKDLDRGVPLESVELVLRQDGCAVRRLPQLQLRAVGSCPAGVKPSSCVTWLGQAEEPPRSVTVGPYPGLEVAARGEAQACGSFGTVLTELTVRAFLLETPVGVFDCSLVLVRDRESPDREPREYRRYREEHLAFCASLRIG